MARSVLAPSIIREGAEEGGVPDRVDGLWTDSSASLAAVGCDNPLWSDQISLLWCRQDLCNFCLRDAAAFHLEAGVVGEPEFHRR